MRFIYSLSIWLFSIIVTLISPFNEKARQWINGRKGVFKILKAEFSEDDKVIWFHCASLGEFEQGRPLMESVKKIFSDHKIILTFFSPSGYEVRKDYEGADVVCYLPADTARNAARFVGIVRPRIAFFIKYEFWFNYINQLSINKIPIFVVSAIFRRSQYFFQPWGKWSRHQLQKVTYFFVQNEKSLALLRMVKVYHADISGDTRFDRVLKLNSEAADYPLISSFKGNHKVIVAGSTWAADEDVLKALMVNSSHSFKMILAPHVVSKEHINQLLEKLKAFNPVLYSQAASNELDKSRVLIIDSVGMLAYLYRFGFVGYVGGGFGVGIHNTIEVATYGIPVIFGPNYERFQEAVELRDLGSGFPVKDAQSCQEVFDKLMDDKKLYLQSAKKASDYVKDNAGAVGKVIEMTKEYL